MLHNNLNRGPDIGMVLIILNLFENPVTIIIDTISYFTAF